MPLVRTNSKHIDEIHAFLYLSHKESNLGGMFDITERLQRFPQFSSIFWFHIRRWWRHRFAIDMEYKMYKCVRSHFRNYWKFCLDSRQNPFKLGEFFMILQWRMISTFHFTCAWQLQTPRPRNSMTRMRSRPIVYEALVARLINNCCLRCYVAFIMLNVL